MELALVTVLQDTDTGRDYLPEHVPGRGDGGPGRGDGGPGLCPPCRDEDELEEHPVALVQLLALPSLLSSGTDAKPQLWHKSEHSVSRVGGV